LVYDNFVYKMEIMDKLPEGSQVVNKGKDIFDQVSLLILRNAFLFYVQILRMTS